MCQFAPSLFRAVGCRRRGCSVRDALHNRQWARDIAGAPTVAILYEYLRLWDLVDNIQLQLMIPDRFVWRWTADDEYTASSAYRAFFIGMTDLVGASDIWRAAVSPKVKFFFWLALHGRL